MSTGEAHKPPPYMLVWVGLFALTIMEVIYATLSSIPKIWLAIGLMAMAFLKAYWVAIYYMHLKWEPKRLWLLVSVPIPLIMIFIFVVLNEIF
jgi:caa(3)-type oxidase subunit IV|tara:strand:+ start:1118 stop:1396 length:279 start_codon:yes stop_codon:yes gene_type:complete